MKNKVGRRVNAKTKGLAPPTVFALFVVSSLLLFRAVAWSAVACVTEGASCLTAVDTTLLGNRTPLILIHGWNPISVPAPPQTDSWTNFVNYYSANTALQVAFKLYYFSYNSNSVDLIHLGRALRDVLDIMNANDPSNFGNKPIAIIAHSMGGLIARYFLTLQQFQGAFAGKAGGERVVKLITLGTPHYGSPLANGFAMIAEAGPTWGAALTSFNVWFYESGRPAYYQVNRSDLYWDNYNDLLDYRTYGDEQNLTLNVLNGNSTYDMKIITYAGSILPSAVCGSDRYCWGATVLRGAFGLANDGVVPLISAQFDGHGVIESRLFFDYNHSELVTGKGSNDTLLFGRIRDDLLTAFQSCHLIKSGDPVPQGWGAPYNLLSQEQELFLKTLCNGNITTFYVVNRGTPANQFQLTWAGNANTPAGYRWTGSSWLPLTLSGGTPFKDSQGNEYPEWRVGAMRTTLLLTQLVTNYVVAYVCTWTGTQWKCGCHDSDCAQNFWQLQAWR